MEGARVMLLALLCWSSMMRSSVATIEFDEELLKNMPKEELAAHISGLLSRPGEKVQLDDLPSQRPPVYWMCDYSCMKNVQIGTREGVFTLDMT